MASTQLDASSTLAGGTMEDKVAMIGNDPAPTYPDGWHAAQGVFTAGWRLDDHILFFRKPVDASPSTAINVPSWWMFLER